MVIINGYEIKSAFSGGDPLKAIYSLGEKVWPTDEPVDYSKQYFRISAGENYTANILLNISSDEAFANYKLYYRRNGKGTWTKITSLQTNLKISVNSYVELKGVNDKLYNSDKDYFSIRSNDSIYERTHIVSGNIMSLLYGDDFIDKNELKSERTFFRLFYYDSTLYDASNLILPATKLTRACYSHMFFATHLEKAPVLPATELAPFCYDSMFEGTSLTTFPELPATTLSDSCYANMFGGCSNLNYVKANFTTTPSTNYTYNWLSGVSSTGTFVANPEATWTTTIERNETTVPAGWTITK